MQPPIPALYVRGNADREVADPEGDDWIAEISLWCSAQLDERLRHFLAHQAETVEVTVDGLGEVFFCHGSPRSDEERLTYLTTEDRLTDALAGVEAGIVLCGHTHMQFDRKAGEVRVVNAGSVGMPYEGRPGAYWCLLDHEGVSLRRTEYDYATAAAAIRASGCPYAEDIAGNVLEPPNREETAAAFEQ